MRFRRYCVTVNDNWTPLRLFWTQAGAKKFYVSRRTFANVFQWRDGAWQWMCGARDLNPNIILWPPQDSGNRT